MIGRYAHRIGEVIGDLTLVAMSKKTDKNHRAFGEFACICGNVARFPAGRVLNGKQKTHCGCKTDRSARKTHGMRSTREYSTWTAMKNRCLCKTSKDYARYGAVGITISDEWASSFESFYSHIGPRPKGTSIDRMDNSKGYEPGNVRWATPSEQQQNRKTSYEWTVKGKRFSSCSEAAAYYRVSEYSVWRWVNGSFDKRRNTFTNPRGDCHADVRY